MGNGLMSSSLHSVLSRTVLVQINFKSPRSLQKDPILSTKNNQNQRGCEWPYVQMRISGTDKGENITMVETKGFAQQVSRKLQVLLSQEIKMLILFSDQHSDPQFVTHF